MQLVQNEFTKYINRYNGTQQFVWFRAVVCQDRFVIGDEFSPFLRIIRSDI